MERFQGFSFQALVFFGLGCGVWDYLDLLFVCLCSAFFSWVNGLRVWVVDFRIAVEGLGLPFLQVGV